MRKRAAFTIVQNEPFFLPLWLDYYRRHFGRDDLYVLDHDTDDGSTANVGPRCNLLRVHRDKSFDHAWLNSTVTAFQAFLLHSYERVLFTEVDEIVVAEPARYAGLGDYIERCAQPVVRCTGFEVVHYPEEEPPLELDRPVLSQRHYWHASSLYSKPLLSSVPMQWSIGFHECVTRPDLAPDPDLFLVHLHRIDYGACVARHRETAARDWNARDVEERLGIQNRLVEEDADFNSWFLRGTDDAERTRIPQRFKTMI